MQRVLGCDKLGNGIASPADRAIGGQNELIVGCRAQLFGTRVDLAGQRLLRGRLQGFRIGTGLCRVGREGESVEAADHMALNDDFAGLADFRIQNAVLPQAAHQYTGTTINETLRKPFMQRVG